MDCHYLNAFAAASTAALRQGFHSAGAEDNAILIFSELMDSQSLFLTAIADTVYYVGIVDLTNGPMVVQTPPMALGTFDDMWFHWIIDFGLPGPDRGEGGRYLLVPQAMTASCPTAAFMWPTPAPTGCCCSGVPSWRTTIPSQPPS